MDPMTVGLIFASIFGAAVSKPPPPPPPPAPAPMRRTESGVKVRLGVTDEEELKPDAGTL